MKEEFLTGGFWLSGRGLKAEIQSAWMKTVERGSSHYQVTSIREVALALNQVHDALQPYVEQKLNSDHSEEICPNPHALFRTSTLPGSAVGVHGQGF